MKNEKLLKLIKEKAAKDAEMRKDPRYLRTMGFLVAKGFLKTEKLFPLRVRMLNVDDAIWAGVNVEPRILEVLPAAIIRFEKYFYFDKTKYPILIEIIKHLKKGELYAKDFHGFLIKN